MADLPLYWPAIEQVEQVESSLILRVAKPLCQPELNQVSASIAAATLDGLENAVEVRYDNAGPAAFVADVRRVSRLDFGNGRQKNFTEPLVTPAGEVQAVIVPLPEGWPKPAGAWLASLDRVVTTAEPPVTSQPGETQPGQPLGLKFADGPQLAAYRLDPARPSACATLNLALQWLGGQPGDRALVQLLDPYGRIVVEHEARPWAGQAGDPLDIRSLPLPGSLPGGRYGLRVRVRTAEGQERPAVTDEGVAIPMDQIPPVPVVVQPIVDPGVVERATPLAAAFDNGISLVGTDLASTQVAGGAWLRFTLIWQTERPLDKELTVFTQLIGPDGQVWGQRDNQPGGGWYGTPLWPLGQPVADHYAFQIQAGAPAGSYRLIAGLYDAETLQRIPVQNGGDFVEVATVQIDETGPGE
jgi:hypothetical protein